MGSSSPMIGDKTVATASCMHVRLGERAGAAGGGKEKELAYLHALILNRAPSYI